MCCCIPCWPFADVDFEREPVNRYGDKYHYVFNESTRAWELRDVVSLFAFLVAKFPPKKLGAAAGQVPLRVSTLLDPKTWSRLEDLLEGRSVCWQDNDHEDSTTDPNLLGYNAGLQVSHVDILP